jgi:methylmalonyl-CoA/ethylmalonyl-CoA epimerase
MEKLEHIGIAVKNMASSNALFSLLLNSQPYKTEEVETEGVRTSFFKAGEVKIELLEAMNDQSPIAKFIDKKGEGIHHLAFSVDNLAESIIDFRNKGFELVNDTPRRGADNKLICFLHPRTTNGVLIELCQDI